MGDKLERCPCCGGKSYVASKVKRIGKVCPHVVRRAHVECRRRPCGLRTKTFKSKEQAIDAWNSRTPPPTTTPEKEL